MAKLPIKTPANIWQNSLDLWQLGLDAQSVIAMRVMGAGGLWYASPDENNMMVAEKQKAMMDSAIAVTTTMMKNGSANDILSAAIKPLAQTTRANRNRLTKGGPRLGQK